MRILYFSRDYTTHDRHFLMSIARSKHEIYYLRLEDDGIAYERRPLPDGVRAVEWPRHYGQVKTPGDWLSLMPAFESVLAEVQPDLVHAGPVQSCGFLTALADFHPFLVMSWGSDILVDADKNELWNWITRYTLEKSDALLCDCDAVREKVESLGSHADYPMAQFPWGINTEHFKPGQHTLGLRERLEWDNMIVVLSTRSWEVTYGIDTLLESFRQAYEQDSRLRLVLLGDGSLRHQVKTTILRYGLVDVVYYPGRVPHVQLPDYFRAANLYLTCAHSDGSSISLLEAMGTGIPVIVTDNPGNREWVQADENGWLVEFGDVAGFTNALLEAACLSAQERRHIGDFNRKIIEARANWQKNIQKLLVLYDILYNRG